MRPEGSSMKLLRSMKGPILSVGLIGTLELVLSWILM